jgi:hypothetical protein
MWARHSPTEVADGGSKVTTMPTAHLLASSRPILR